VSTSSVRPRDALTPPCCRNYTPRSRGVRASALAVPRKRRAAGRSPICQRCALCEALASAESRWALHQNAAPVLPSLLANRRLRCGIGCWGSLVSQLRRSRFRLRCRCVRFHCQLISASLLPHPTELRLRCPTAVAHAGRAPVGRANGRLQVRGEHTASRRHRSRTQSRPQVEVSALRILCPVARSSAIPYSSSFLEISQSQISNIFHVLVLVIALARVYVRKSLTCDADVAYVHQASRASPKESSDNLISRVSRASANVRICNVGCLAFVVSVSKQPGVVYTAGALAFNQAALHTPSAGHQLLSPRLQRRS